MIIPIKANRHRIGNGQVSVMNPMPICFLFVGNDVSKHIELDRYSLPVVDDIEFVECTVGIGKHVNGFHLVISVFGSLECIHDNCRDFLL